MKIFKGLIIILIFATIIGAETDLEDHSDYLNPVDGTEGDYPEKDQDKRTVLSSHHGWAKHVGVHPAGFKYVLGYSPVNLKLVPVVKPLLRYPHYHHHHHIIKPRPVVPIKQIVHHNGWRPILRPVVKPVVPIHVPPAVKPWPGWHKPIVKPVHHVTVVKPVHEEVHIHKPIHFVPSKPLIPVAPAVPVAHPVPIAPAVPIAHPVPVAPAVPLFEVARPNFPVLPLGASFPAKVLPHPPAPVVEFHGHHHHHHLLPAPQPALIPAPHAHALPVPHAHIIHPHTHALHPHLHTLQPHLHAAPPHIHPAQPHLHALEPHLHPAQPHLHALDPHLHPAQPHLHALDPHLHPAQPHLHALDPHLHPAQPHLHALEPHLHPAQPHLHALDPHLHALQPHLHAAQPHLHPHHSAIPEQQVPHFHHVDAPHVHSEVPSQPGHDQQHHNQDPLPQQNPHVLFQQQLPGNVHHEYSQQVNTDHSSVYVSQNLDIPSIQPGHTDLQLPAHLPQHPNYLPDGRAFPDPNQQIFRPSAILEPPYTHK